MMRPWKTTCVGVGGAAFWLILVLCGGNAYGEEGEIGTLSSSEGQELPAELQVTEGKKLLIIMLDGFRWDYYELQKNELRGFPLFLKDGVQAQWVETVFPSESFPAWTTISTGVYPEVHGILGNYMHDLKYNATFDLDNDETTGLIHWWQNAEPLWTTATRYNKKAFLHYWSRCDVPFQDIVPHRCTSYRSAPGVRPINETLNAAINHLLQGYDLAMVYGEHLDNVGHLFGPYSEELKQAVRDVDDVIHDFLDRLTDVGLDDEINVIIVGDHGMKWIGDGSGTIYVPMDDFVNSKLVYRVAGYGTTMAIAPYSGELERVYRMLKDSARGFDVYMRDEIPEEFRYKNNRLVQDILVVAKPGYFLLGLRSKKQIPGYAFQPTIRGGTHGYVNMTQMRTIFFARGPDFKKGIVHPPIELVDQYQLFAKLLGVPPRPNNGTWSAVAGMLANDAISNDPTNLNVVLLLVPLVTVSLINLQHYW